MRKRCLFLVSLFIVTFSVILSQSQLNLNQNSGNLVKEGITKPISASSHSPIFIDGNSALNAFCSGKGTTGLSWETAHVIENYEIDAGGSGSGIEIRNTNLYLIIRNITASNSGDRNYDAGIYLSNSNNVKIIDNDFNNNQYGIFLLDSNFNNLTGNNLWNNTDDGFYLFYSSNNILSGNNASNHNAGFIFHFSSNNTISGNQAWNNDYSSFELKHSNNNILSGNIGWNNYFGGFDFYNSSNNKFMENIAFENNFGFRSESSNNNNLGENNASDNTTGFIFSLSNNNTLTGNIASENAGSFHLSNSNNNKLLRNIATENSGGFSLSTSNNNVLSGNNASNQSSGFSISSSDYNIFSGNNAWNISIKSFTFYSSNYNIFSGNNAWNNTYEAFDLTNSSNNIFSGNNAFENGGGFSISSSSNNEFSGNYAWNNTANNFYFDFSTNNNRIWSNFFSDSLVAPARDDGIDNQWDNGIIGNFWDDYLEKYPAASDIGDIWDTPYGISGDAGSLDRFPLVNILTFGDNNLSAQFTSNITEINAGHWIRFSHTSTGGNPPFNFQWNFGDGSANSTQPNPIHQYNLHGNFTVTLTVTDFDGDNDTISINNYVSVIDLLPTANFMANNTQISMNYNTVLFTSTGFEGDLPTTFQWNFGDGTANSSERNPIHTYISSGNYTVTLTVTDFDGDTDTLIKENYISLINLLPIADFMADVTEISLKYNTVHFTFIGTEGDLPITYQWNFGDGSANSTDPNPIHQYFSLGNYNVTLTVTDFNGDTDTLTKENYISLIDLFPIADFHTTTTQIDLNNITAQFLFDGFEGDEPATFQWSFGDNTTSSSERNPIHTYISSGNYTVILTVTDVDGDIDSIEVIINIEDTENVSSSDFFIQILISILFIGGFGAVFVVIRKLMGSKKGSSEPLLY